jgi:type I restriction enzyme, R subunit
MRSGPRDAVIYARRVLEQMVVHLYDVARLPPPYASDLSARMNTADFRNLVGPGIAAKMNAIRKAGNIAAHETRVIQAPAALQVVRELHHVVSWTTFRYSMSAQQPTAGRFDPQFAAPPAAGVRPLSNAELNTLLARFSAQDDQLAAAKAANEDLEAELSALRHQIAEAQAAKATTADQHDYDEAAPP